MNNKFIKINCKIALILAAVEFIKNLYLFFNDDLDIAYRQYMYNAFHSVSPINILIWLYWAYLSIFISILLFNDIKHFFINRKRKKD